jgi:chromosomal replication initiator protein
MERPDRSYGLRLALDQTRRDLFAAKCGGTPNGSWRERYGRRASGGGFGETHWRRCRSRFATRGVALVQDVSNQPTPPPERSVKGAQPTPAEQDIGPIWQAVRERLRESVPDSTYRLWLEPLRAAAAQGDTLYVNAPDGIRAWVERRYARMIGEALSQVAETLRQVSFAAPPGSAAAASSGDCADDTGRNPNYTFERFVIGPGNRLAHGAALAVAEAPAEAYNPLFLHGPPGLGKTHLLVAIANYLADSAPQLRVRYTTAERFTNEFVAALHASGAEAFKQRYRDIDVLLIDDVQFLEGKHHTEEEFFHTFNALYESGSQIVLSADRIPSELSTLAARLRDRFEWGLTLAVEPPNLLTRLTVLRRLVMETGTEIVGEDALGEIARRIDANIRQLHGALTRVIAHASLKTQPVSSELIAEVIPGAHRGEATMAVEQIQELVACSFGLSRQSLISSSRAATPLRARQLAIYLTRETTDLSLPQIGRAFGGRDHATVLNSLRRTEARAKVDPETRETLERLRRAIHSD